MDDMVGPLIARAAFGVTRGLVAGLGMALAMVGCDAGDAQPGGAQSGGVPSVNRQFVNHENHLVLQPATTVAAASPAGPVAFPGAQGFGAVAQGGRGGRIIAITTLADDGPGSYRECVTAAGPRVCVFRVSGVIRFTDTPPVIDEPFLTIAGETAPGEGIILAHAGGPQGRTPLVIKNTHDVVVRHIRSRPDLIGEPRGSNDAITIENSSRVIVDHVSGSWALDENINGYGQNDQITISWSIFAEGIPRHDKCALLGSDPTGPQRFSFLNNLCAHNGDRNPDINFAPQSCVEVYNNVFYNAGSQFAEVWESYGGTPVNIAGNVFRAGPETEPSAVGIDRETIGSTGAARVWVSGNLFDGAFTNVAPGLAAILTPQPVCQPTIAIRSAQDTYRTVLAGAGAFPRDSFDRRIVEQVQARKGHFVHQGGPMPVLAGGTPYVDADGDGMSDAWEATQGTDPAVPDSWGDRDGDGIANLEAFLAHAHDRRMAGQPVT